ncbi:MAG: hypothetical protein U0Z70_03825 [Thermomicrobiales bacterium]
MGTFSTWELRTARGERAALSDEQIEQWTYWGLLRTPADGTWTEEDIKRTSQILALKGKVRSLPRRAVVLFDARYPTDPGKLRRAMIAVLPAISRTMHKMWQIDEALRTRREGVNAPLSPKQRRSARWRVPVQDFKKLLSGFTDEEFARIAGVAYTDAWSLRKHPAVIKERTLEDIPFEELVILLTVRQMAMSGVMQPEVLGHSST